MKRREKWVIFIFCIFDKEEYKEILRGMGYEPKDETDDFENEVL